MAKQQPLPDRFRITCETSEQEMGVLIAQLTRMGFTNISFELITDIPTYKRNAVRDASAPAEQQQNAQDFALAYINEHPTFAARDLAKHFKANGRNGAAFYYALGKLVEKGAIIDLGDRNYQRADVRAIEPPKAITTNPISGQETILRFARKHKGKFNTQQLRKLFEDEGRNVNSVSPSCDHLLRKKLIKRVGESGSGEYALLAKGKTATVKAKPKAKAAAPTPAPHLNGGSHEPATNSEAVING